MFLFLVCSVGFNFLSQTSRFGGILARDFTFGGSYLREFYADPNFFRIGKKAHVKTNNMHVFIFDFFPFLSNFRKKTDRFGGILARDFTFGESYLGEYLFSFCFS